VSVKESARSLLEHLLLRGIKPWRVSLRAAGSQLAQSLGYDSACKLLIVNADDFGVHPDVNKAILGCFENEAITSTSVMVPCPAFVAAARASRSGALDVGVHLTLTSEWPKYRWAPVLGAASVPSLVDSTGFLPRTVREVFAHARLEEVEVELRGQIDRALDAGIDVTHIDNHMFALQGARRDYYELYVRLAQDYCLPLRAIRRTLKQRWTGVDRNPLTHDMSAPLSPDHIVFAGWYDYHNAAEYWSEALSQLPAGVTEIYCHPGFCTSSLAGDLEDAPRRQAEYSFFTSKSASEMIATRGIVRIGYRALRDVMRTDPRFPPRTSVAAK